MDVLSQIEDCSVDSLITDPPAGISFMGKKWDSSKDFIGKMTGIYRECLRIMKPGAHGLVWAIPRTSHWTATALELAGFEIRDQICHLFGSGFPKSMDLDKQLRKDALVCMCNEYVETKKAKTNLSDMQNRIHPQEPNSTIEGDRTSQRRLYCSECGKLKKEFSKGFGTNLKPAHEIWWLIRKPTSEDTVAKNVLKHGTGGLNIDASRIGTTDNLNGGAYTKGRAPRSMNPGGINQVNVSDLGEYNQPQGRFPSNLILSHNPDCLDDGWVSPDGTVKLSGCMPGCAVAELDAQSDSGGASRFFYCAKASRSDKGAATNTHPTPKSTKLMQYLITLITPSGGTVLDPFMGSGSTGVAAKRLGFHFIGIEKEADYFKIAKERIDSA